MTKKQKKELAKSKRNFIALNAILRSGAGKHGDAKKENSKNKCRVKIKFEDS